MRPRGALNNCNTHHQQCKRICLLAEEVALDGVAVHAVIRWMPVWFQIMFKSTGRFNWLRKDRIDNQKCSAQQQQQQQQHSAV